MVDKLAINRRIAKLFYAKAEILKAKGEKYKFRSLAYFKAVQALSKQKRGLDDIYKHGWLRGLEKIDGIGNRLAHEIEALLKKRE
jgi:DNA polymerase/3'-5' exonuclease PolX